MPIALSVRRIDDPDDHVRWELARALELEQPVKLVLINERPMPEGLPSDISRVEKLMGIPVLVRLKASVSELARVIRNDLKNENPKLFISYRRTDQTEAELLVAKLRDEGLRIWIDTEPVETARDLRPFLLKKIQGCDAVLALIGPHWEGRTWAKRRLTGLIAAPLLLATTFLAMSIGPSCGPPGDTDRGGTGPVSGSSGEGGSSSPGGTDPGGAAGSGGVAGAGGAAGRGGDGGAAGSGAQGGKGKGGGSVQLHKCCRESGLRADCSDPSCTACPGLRKCKE